MKKYVISLVVLIAYCAVLVKVMVFKDLPTIKIGQLMLNFGGTDTGHAPNFVPFTTIVPYVLGYKGLIIAGVNLIGNVALLVPIGLLLPLVYKDITWKKSLVVAVASGLSIELLQTVLRVGIFDIDDVILNALGVMIGYGAFVIITKWVRSKNYKSIIVAAIVCIAGIACAFYIVYPWGQPVRPEPRTDDVQYDRYNNEETAIPASGDLCGGTGGIGEITFTIILRDGRDQIVNLASMPTIKTPEGTASLSDLQIGNRVTLVGDVNPDGNFTAHTVLVCN